MSPIRVMLVDDHPVVLEGVKQLLHQEPDIEICAQARSGEEAVASLAQTPTDIILMDIRLPGLGGIETSRQVSQAYPQVKVLLLTGYGEQYLAQAMESGACGYLLKDIKRAELIQAIRSAYSGATAGDAPLGFTLFPRVPGMWKRLYLSPRQQEIIQLVALGVTNKEMAYRLHLSDTTVKREMRSIFDKLGASDRAEAVSLAHRQGLLP